MYGGSRWGSKEGSCTDRRGSWRGERVQGGELEDTAISPHKSDSRLSSVADLIRRQREGEERDRQLREVAWEAGLGFGRGDSRDGALSQNSASNTISSSTRQGDDHASHLGSGCMQADKGVGPGLDLNIAAEEQVPIVDDGDSVGEQGGGDSGVGRPWSLTQDSDPFNLGPLIAGARRSEEGRVKRKGLGSMGGQDADFCRLGKRQYMVILVLFVGVSDTIGEGIGGPLTVSSLTEQVRLQAPDIVVLLETKNKAYRYGWLKKQLGMNYMHVVEPRGLSGGLCMFWKDAQQVVLVKYAGFLIEVSVHDVLLDYTWRFFAVYASTDVGIRRSQWGALQERINTCPEGCLVMGDFNDILEASEKEGGRPRSVQSMAAFRGFVTDSNLLDLGYEGFPFTWRNRRDDGGIQERLDRGLLTPTGSATTLQHVWFIRWMRVRIMLCYCFTLRILLHVELPALSLIQGGARWNDVMSWLRNDGVGVSVGLGVCRCSRNLNG
ncbi:unnamed protein product [Prunus brigantina]